MNNFAICTTTELIGTYDHIMKEIGKYAEDQKYKSYISKQGMLFKLIDANGVENRIFNKAAENKLLFRGRNNCFMQPGSQCTGTTNLSEQGKIWQLVEICEDTHFLDIKSLLKEYNINFSPKRSNEYY